MSFCNNLRPERGPGRISGNPMSGLCERVCLQAKKVFDACLSQYSQEELTVTLSETSPAGLVQPFTFVSATAASSTATVTDAIVSVIAEGDNCKRVQATVIVPVTVNFTDANGTAGVGVGTVSFDKDIVLNVPSDSLIPVQIAASANLVAPIGNWVSGTTFTLIACVTLLVKVEAEVEILLPSYGYCYIPPCREYTTDACEGLFNLPLFPRS